MRYSKTVLGAAILSALSALSPPDSFGAIPCPALVTHQLRGSGGGEFNGTATGGGLPSSGTSFTAGTSGSANVRTTITARVSGNTLVCELGASSAAIVVQERD